MNREFGSKASDLLCCIGPCISKECYEVSGDVADEFRKLLQQINLKRSANRQTEKTENIFLICPWQIITYLQTAALNPGK